MPFLLACLLSVALWLAPALSPTAIAAPFSLPLGVLPGLEGVFAGDTPELGLTAGTLLPCPSSPNCVISQGGDETHHIQPITYNGDRDAARSLLIKVLGVVPRTEIVAQTDDYIRAKATSRLMGFVDDVEFYFPKDEPIIHLRSAARLGESDLGVNRRRLEQIRLALQDLGI
jgi:uncharacterized protein (DUF1499 family)